MSLSHLYNASLQRHRLVFDTLETHEQALITVFEKCQQAIALGGKILFCGNGGSAADSQHLAAELMVRYKKERAPIRAIALSTDTSIITAQSNDYVFDSIFERQVQGMADSKDVVIGLSTSGNSRNVVLALHAANKIGAYSVALTGCDGGKIKSVANLSIIVNSHETARIQEAHLFMGHWLCEAFDQTLAS